MSEIDVRIVLLKTVAPESRSEIHDELTHIIQPPDQTAYGGNPAEFIDLEHQPERHVFLIYADAQLVGVGSLMTGAVSTGLWPPRTPAIQLRGFVVDPAQQGRGIGTKATRALIDVARGIDPDAQHLILSVNQRNPGAKRAYERAGFRIWPEPYLGGPIGPQDIMYFNMK